MSALPDLESSETIADITAMREQEANAERYVMRRELDRQAFEQDIPYQTEAQRQHAIRQWNEGYDKCIDTLIARKREATCTNSA